MRHLTVWTLIASLALVGVGVASADDAPTQAPAKTTKHGDFAQRILKKYDKNGDGFLQADELAAMVAAHEKHAAESGKTTTKDGQPKPTAESLMKKFDTNGDGKLDATELQAMAKELHARHEAHKKAATT